ncbi:hypothetical protein FBUS_11431 [Fasciolopsis buskii]|uniref:Uncharacterized protein n=1 Tax=Fasciolopsis buskii TaxID=27845 RepID=A0A8E0S9I1_9TREM|nr:hypothetical protein FBUS_11431 [Fasciolopsis buski]
MSLAVTHRPSILKTVPYFTTDETNQAAIVSYRFYVPDKENFLKPFHKTNDRRLLRIANITNCTITLSRLVRIHRGERMRTVRVSGPSKSSVEYCIRQIDESFPHFYATASLQRSLDDLKYPTIDQIGRYTTTENVSTGDTTEIVYYKLRFYILSGCQVAYEKWKRDRVACTIEKMDCHLVVSQRDHTDLGFARRYAVILGPKRRDVMQAYRLFHTSFISNYW